MIFSPVRERSFDSVMNGGARRARRTARFARKSLFFARAKKRAFCREIAFKIALKGTAESPVNIVFRPVLKDM